MYQLLVLLTESSSWCSSCIGCGSDVSVILSPRGELCAPGAQSDIWDVVATQMLSIKNGWVDETFPLPSMRYLARGRSLLCQADVQDTRPAVVLLVCMWVPESHLMGSGLLTAKGFVSWVYCFGATARCKVHFHFGYSAVQRSGEQFSLVLPQ